MRAHDHGYTLLELVIGMTLVSMLMTVLAIGIGVGTRAWQKGEARIQQSRAEAERTGFVLEQVASMVPYRVVSTNSDLPGEWPILEASPFWFRFVSTQGSRYRDRSGLLLVEYSVVRTVSGTVDVVLGETPVSDDALLLHRLIDRLDRDPDSGQRTIIFRHPALHPAALRLMTGLRAARFDYLDPQPKPGAPPAWVPRFDSRPETLFPAAVRLRWLRSDRTEAEAQVFPLRARVPAQELSPQ